MKRNILLLMMALFPFLLYAQSYDSLWKQVEDAEDKDQPRTEIGVLDKIVAKAQKGKDYGHLLSAELMRASLQVKISPDSLEPEVKRLQMEADLAEKRDPVMAAIFQVALGKVWENTASRHDVENRAKAQMAYEKAVRHPELLARHQISEYEPLISKEQDSRIFHDDLLHVVCMETKNYKVMYDYYSKGGDRKAACIAAAMYMRRSGSIDDVDSLMNVYGDLQESGELAKVRYSMMYGKPQERLDFVNKMLEKYPSWQMEELVNARRELLNPNFDAHFKRDLSLPGQTQEVVLSGVRNIRELKLVIHKLNATGGDDIDVEKYEDKRNYKHLIENTVSVDCSFADRNPYESTRDTLLLPALPVGVYVIEFHADGKELQKKRHLYYVSDVYVMMEGVPVKTIRFAVVNATTGQPLPGAKVRISYRRYGNNNDVEPVTLTTDGKGEVFYDYSKNKKGLPDYVFAYTDTDKAFKESYVENRFNFYDRKSAGHRIAVYTDRSIYRPGQDVHVSLVVYNQDDTTTKAVVGESVSLRLKDANYKVVEEKKVTTDDYGTAAADFALPQGGLTGRYSVEAYYQTYGSATFHVEEYKRPTYEVEFEDYKEPYKAGDDVKVTGYAKTYAGVPVQNAAVKYTVKRRRAVWCWWYGGADNDVELSTGETTTDENGAFHVTMPMKLPSDDSRLFYQIITEVKVTDQGGETHEGSMSLPLGSKPTSLGCDIPQKILAEKLRKVTFSYRNMAGQEIDDMVRFSIDGKPFMGNKAFKTNQPVTLQPLSSGKHHLVATCGTDTLEYDFIVFSMTDKRPVTDTDDWFYVSSNKFTRDGKPVYVQVGASVPQQHIVYSVVAGNKVIEHGVIDQSNAITTHKFTYDEKYEQGIVVTYAWVKDGRMYYHHAEIERPLPDKSLKLSWKTFRDRLTPGQKEEWVLTVQRPDGKPADAQFMATLYDKSLDQIYKHSWTFETYISNSLPSLAWCGRPSSSGFSIYYQAEYEREKTKDLSFSRFDERYLAGLRYYYPEVFEERMMVMKSSMANGVKIRGRGMMEESAELTDAAMYSADAEDAAEDAGTAKNNGQVRENLNETAFFYPQLHTDSKGNVTIAFTLPESVTTWRLLGIAHDKEMNAGYIEGDAVAKKTVMVQPNVPRFIRHSDKASLAARVFNTSDKQVQGKALLQLLEPLTEKVVLSQSKDYVLKAEGSETVTFDIETAELPADLSLLIARVSVDGDGYSDGEQHYLPVLPAWEQVLNTMPFTQHGEGVKTIEVAKMLPPTASQRKVTLEYTANPVWLLLQALPVMGDYTDENAINLATALYANTIAKSILLSSPQIKKVMEQWRMEKGEENSLMSNLQKNEDLKELILSETPWVADAEGEAAQKRALSRYFDENTIANRLSDGVSKLRKLQLGDGSWSWWKGMDGSIYMTVEVCKTLVRLNAILGNQSSTTSMLDKAFPYMAEYFHKEVENLKKYVKEGIKNPLPSELAMDYLYTCVLDGRKLPAKAQADNDYMIELLKKQSKNLTIYGKANVAVILAKSGDKKKSREFIQSMKEYSVYTEEMGRYYDTRKAYYSWCDYKIPTEVAAIEALKMLEPDDRQTIEEMQRWLLQCKRTQAWDTPVNSVNAVYAFLYPQETNVLVAPSAPVVTLDSHEMSLPEGSAGIGYFKTAIDEGTQTMEVRKTDSGTSWGAVYAQFVQPVTDVDAAASGLTVTREWLRNGEVIDPATTVLHVGEKVVARITVKADRDYDFVQVIDKRAACLEPVGQLSGYHWGYYCAPKDFSTSYYFNMMAKGTHKVETTYYVDRTGTYQTGSCTAQCAYSPEYSGRAKAVTITVE